MVKTQFFGIMKYLQFIIIVFIAFNNMKTINAQKTTNQKSWKFFTKTLYKYNSQGKLSEEIKYKWDYRNNKFSPTRKKQYLYDSSGVNTTHYLDWNSYKKKWIEDDNYYQFFDLNGNLIYEEYIYTSEKRLFSWQKSSRRNNYYNHSGKMIKKIEDVWDSKSNKWKKYKKVIFEYNERGKEIYKLRKLWNDEKQKYINYYKRISVYDKSNSEHNVTTMFKWDKEANKWVNYFWVELSEGGENNTYWETGKRWNKGKKIWESDSKWKYLYDSNGNWLYDEIYKLDKKSGKLYCSNKTWRIFDSNNNKIELLNIEYNTKMNSWENDYKIKYKYNRLGDIVEEVKQKWK